VKQFGPAPMTPQSGGQNPIAMLLDKLLGAHQLSSAVQGPAAPTAMDGMNQGAQGMAQGFNGATRQPTTAHEGINRANTPGAMDANPIAQLVQSILAALTGGGRM
jgi:hypothetical protein